MLKETTLMTWCNWENWRTWASSFLLHPESVFLTGWIPRPKENTLPTFLSHPHCEIEPCECVCECVCIRRKKKKSTKTINQSSRTDSLLSHQTQTVGRLVVKTSFFKAHFAVPASFWPINKLCRAARRTHKPVKKIAAVCGCLPSWNIYFTLRTKYSVWRAAAASFMSWSDWNHF